MSRVLLISANTCTDPHAAYPLGMALVAAATAERGHEVRQFDLLAARGSLDLLREAVVDFAPDVVGLSVRNIDSCDSLSPGQGWQLEAVRDVVTALRASTGASVVVGGGALSILREELLDFLQADHGVAGEGERAFPDLVEDLARGRVPARIVDGGRLFRGDELGTPLWDRNLVDFYQDSAGHVNYQIKRGCPHRCAYCSYPALEGRRWRFRPPKAVVDDLERAHRDHGVREVFFTDSVFNDGAGHYLEVAEELIRRELGLKWCALIRPKGLRRKDAALLRRAGLQAAEIGSDAATDTTLGELDKGFSFDEVVKVNEALLQAEVPCAHFILFGGPGETDATVAEGLGNLDRLGKSVVFAFLGVRVLPGTPMHARAVREGVLEARQPLLRPVYYYSPHISPEAVSRRLSDAFGGRRNRLFPPGEAEMRLAVMRRFGFRGLLWDRLVVFGPRPRNRATASGTGD